MSVPNELAKQIVVDAESFFIEQQSDAEEQRFVFSYEITITNESEAQVQLLSRSWLITDADGKKVSVQGDGVVGQQPKISPGKSYSYNSGSVIKTPFGTMEGFYQMITEQGEMIQVEIPVFSLSVPNIVH